MELTSKTSGLDEKLDGLLSLLMHDFEDVAGNSARLIFMIVMVNSLEKNCTICRKFYLKTAW